jgi:2-polyprenyl-6-methoxyphenol hydroxylase-like FAD-dependent oxidoreductase
LADVASLARVLAAREPWRSVGDERLLRRHVRERAAATQAMALVTDGLLRLFAAEPAFVRELRNRGLTLVDHARPIKRWLVSHALDS